MDLSTGPSTDRPDLELALGEFITLSDAFDPAFMVSIGGTGIAPRPSIVGPSSACPLDSATTLFTCAKFGTADAVGGFAHAVIRSYQLLSDGGLPLTAYDKGKVAAIRHIQDRETKGRFLKAGKVTTILDSAHNDFTMSGLLVAPRVINGSGTSNAVYTDSVSGGTQVAVSSYAMANVAMPQLTPGNAFYNWPASGVVTFSVTVSGAGIATDTVTVQVTFTGGNKASYTRTQAGTTDHGTCFTNITGNQASSGCNPLP